MTWRQGRSWILLAISLAAGAAHGASFDLMQSAFTGGELSPLAAARIDAPRYYQSALTIENLVAIPQGPLVRRPGTHFAAATDGNDPARLVAFRYSRADSYVLEFTDLLMRVYREHALVTNADETIYTLVTPFDANELASLQFWQNGDTAYIADGTDWPQKLVRTDHNDWSIADANIQDGPFLKENTTATTIAADANTGDVNLVATAAVFDANHVGSYWRLRDLVGIQSTSKVISDLNDATSSLYCQNGGSFEWKVTTNGHFTVELQMSFDGGSTWKPYTSLTSEGDVATTPTEVFDNDSGQDAYLRAFVTEYTSGSGHMKLWVHTYTHTGVAQITAVTDPCHAAATVVRTLAGTEATTQWSEGAWSVYRGFPRAIGGYSDRLVLAGTQYRPLTIWFSATGEHESFDTGVGDDADGFGYGINRAEQDPIVWVTAQRGKGLTVGTSGSIFELQPMDSALAITPSNFPTVTSTVAVPCAAVQPVGADNVLLVLQRDGRKIREVLYSYEADSLVAPDLVLFAEHVTQSGLTAMTWVGQPYTALWACRADGELVTLTYDRSYQISAPSRQVLGGSGVVESLCSIPNGAEDELWFSVRRTIDANTVRYVEYLAPWDWGPDPNDGFFVDCGITVEGTATTDFNGLDHLEGATVAVFADAASAAEQTVSAGAVTIERAAAICQIGLPFTSTLQTVRYDVSGDQGATWGRKKGLTKAVVSWHETLGARVGPDLGHLLPPLFAVPGAVVSGGAPALFSGDTEVTFPAAYGSDRAKLWIVQESPYPMTIRAVTATVEVR